MGAQQYWAWVKEYNGLQCDTRIGVATIAAGGSCCWIPVDWIIGLAGLLNDGGLRIVVGDVPEIME
jgi:hypothetical protein